MAFGIERIRASIETPVRNTAVIATAALVIAVIALVIAVGGRNGS